MLSANARCCIAAAATLTIIGGTLAGDRTPPTLLYHGAVDPWRPCAALTPTLGLSTLWDYDCVRCLQYITAAGRKEQAMARSLVGFTPCEESTEDVYVYVWVVCMYVRTVV